MLNFRYFIPLILCLGTVTTAHAATYYVRAGDNLQTFLNTAVSGDTLILEAGATFRGNFVLPKRATPGWVFIRSSMESMLPAGKRVTPAEAKYMPKLETAMDIPTLVAAAGTSGWYMIGLEITHAPGVYAWSTVCLGYGTEKSATELPENIRIDRSYIHGDPVAGGKRGVAMNGRGMQVMNSWISDYKHRYLDTQAIGGWGGPGPFKILNNYLEASGENIMFGGAVPGITGTVPSDILIRGNDLVKPLSWRSAAWCIKNHFELKNAARVTFDGNVLENNWANAYGGGTSIVLTPRTENGLLPWVKVEDVTISNNVIRNVGEGMRLLGYENTSYTRRITVRNNIFEVNRTTWGGSGAVAMPVLPVQGLSITHNTMVYDNTAVYFAYFVSPGMVFNNNIAVGPCNIAADNLGCGLSVITAAGAAVQGNVGAVTPLSMWPSGNWVVPSAADLQFVSPSTQDYTLPATSPFKGKATDGTDPGVNMPALRNARKVTGS